MITFHLSITTMLLHTSQYFNIGSQGCTIMTDSSNCGDIVETHKCSSVSDDNIDHVSDNDAAVLLPCFTGE